MGAQERGGGGLGPEGPRAAVREGPDRGWPALPPARENVQARPELPLERSAAVTSAGPDLKKHACPKEETWTRKSGAGFGVGGRKPRPAPPANFSAPARSTPRPGSLGSFSHLKPGIKYSFLMLSNRHCRVKESHGVLLKLK